MVATVLLSIVVLLLGLQAPAAGLQPTTPPNEGSTPTLQTLRANLESAAAGYIEAEARRDRSLARQAELQQQVVQADADIARTRESVKKYAGEAYKTGRLSGIAYMLNATSQDEFLKKVMAFDRLRQRDQSSIDLYEEAQYRVIAAKSEIDAEVEKQSVEAAEMAKRRQAAERALAAVGGTAARVNIDPATLPDATPAPRNPDGSWPSEGCNQDDPTTSGCLTPRTLHAYNETKADGFSYYVSCFRTGDQYEHPKGRACDWAAFPGGFVNSSASGSGKVYGDRLASYYAKNAKALGVMYIVWYCQIWHVGTGWKRYNSSGSRCGDAPAPDHTNHVHLSIY
jgi:hypothetical protein